ncbi:SCO7613 C-terminal domain-containing membrane protein [Kitasatospora sp. NPDC050543]|uniref:SCO7613 C-terminal domain-containing membrane protein n=1 Tax=Kitasatospora sp. NPDC050543 TaxID=3364054 RepID=UPI0037A1B03B
MTSSLPGSPPPVCPDCGALFGTARVDRCPHCRLPLDTAEAATLWQVTSALHALDAQRLTLLRQRDGLLAGLRARRDAPRSAPPSARTGVGGKGAAGKGEVSGTSAQTALLVLGGLLVTTAALVFTVVSWGHLGIAGRAVVLALLTGCALALPYPLRRRGLRATAETSAAIGLALVLLDFLAARSAGLAGLDRVDGLGYWAVATALAGPGAAAYGWAMRLRLPLAAGFLLGRLPALLAVPAVGISGPQGGAAAMVLTAALDYPVLRMLAGHEGLPARLDIPAEDGASEDRASEDGASGDAARGRGGLLLRSAETFAAAWAVLGGALAAIGSLQAGLRLPRTGPTGTGDAAAAVVGWAWLPLGGLALLALAVALPGPVLGYPGLPYPARRLAAGLAGGSLLLAAGGTVGHLLAPGWGALAYGAPAALLLAPAGILLRRAMAVTSAMTAQAGAETGVGTDLETEAAEAPGVSEAADARAGLAVPAGLFAAAALVLLVSSVTSLGELARALAEPLGQLPAAWSGGPAPAWGWHVAPAAVSSLWLLVVALAVAAVLDVGPVPAASLRAATALAVVPAVALLPVAFGLPYGVAVVAAGALAVVAAGSAVLRPVRRVTLIGLTAAAPLALLWASADRTATIVALAVAAVLAIVLSTPAAAGSEVRPAVAAACAVLALGAEAAAVGSTTGLALPDTMLGVLAVAIGSAPVAARVEGGTSRAVELSGYVLAAVALGLTAPYPGRFAFALTVAGVAALGVALRPDRRRAAAVTSTALLTVASWVRLALSGVHTPEPYTVSVAAAALVLGRLHRRRYPDANSWTCHGPGLALGLLPSLVAMWADGFWLRPLLLGSVALAVTVLGGRQGLQCPLLLGGGVLVLVGLHELAPVVVQALGLLPRWVPLAGAGLLLLALGATYEQRLRDARRLRDSLLRLH